MIDIPSNILSFDHIRNFLDLGVELSNKEWDYSPFKYIIKIIIDKNFEKYDDYKKFVLYVWNIVFNYPYLVNDFQNLVENWFISFPLEKSNFIEIISNIINKLLLENIKNYKQDIILRSLYISIIYNIDIYEFEKISDIIIKFNAPILNLLLFLYTNKKGLKNDKYFKILSSIDQKEWWLYIYELYRKDKSKVIRRITDLQYKDFYNYLLSNNVSFLNDK
jgi:hypothetical protein